MHGVLSFAALSCLPSPICVTNSGCTANLLPEWTECPMQHVLFLFLFLIALFIFTHIGPALLTVRGNGKVIDRSGCNCYFWYFFMRKKKLVCSSGMGTMWDAEADLKLQAWKSHPLPSFLVYLGWSLSGDLYQPSGDCEDPPAGCRWDHHWTSSQCTECGPWPGLLRSL